MVKENRIEIQYENFLNKYIAREYFLSVNLAKIENISLLSVCSTYVALSLAVISLNNISNDDSLIITLLL